MFGVIIFIPSLLDNQIGDGGCVFLSSALKSNTTLTCLILSSIVIDIYHVENWIGNEGAKEMASALKTNKTLTELAFNCISHSIRISKCTWS